MSHYTIGYHDQQRHHFEICEYADNTFDAIQHAKEDVPFLKDHPQYIDEVLLEKHDFQSTKQITLMMNGLMKIL